MSFAFRPPTVDFLTQAIELVRPQLDRSIPTKSRVRTFWSAVVAARNLGATDVVGEEFTALAVSCGLTTDLGFHGRKDIAHLIRWGLLARDPFGGY
jgi:hypothetical protein